jgi:hypothetical protein
MPGGAAGGQMSAAIPCSVEGQEFVVSPQLESPALEAGAEVFDTLNGVEKLPVKGRVVYLCFGQFFVIET